MLSTAHLWIEVEVILGSHAGTASLGHHRHFWL